MQLSKTLVVSVLFLAAGAAHGATFSCPTVNPPTPLPGPVVLDTWKDAKGGIWSLTCTNSSRSGDFIWEYQAAPGGAEKQIGKCIYVGGQNRTSEDIDPVTKNVKVWRHTCFKPMPTPDGKYCAILDIFDKAACKTTRRYLKYDPAAPTPRWEEASIRRETTNAMYAAFSPSDKNGDSISDEGFNWLSSDLYPDPDTELPAVYSNRTTINVNSGPGGLVLSWDVGQINPILTPGDKIHFSHLTAGMLGAIDPRYTPADTANGLVLTANTTIPLVTGQMLAMVSVAVPTAAGVAPAGLVTRWAIEDVGAADYWSNVFDDPRPLQDIGFSNNLDFSDSPGFASAYGNIALVNVPTVSEWGLIAMGIGFAVGGPFILRRTGIA